MTEKHLSDELLEHIDALDKKGGAGLRRAKAYSIEALEKEGYTAAEISDLLGLAPRKKNPR